MTEKLDNLPSSRPVSTPSSTEPGAATSSKDTFESNLSPGQKNMVQALRKLDTTRGENQRFPLAVAEHEIPQKKQAQNQQRTHEESPKMTGAEKEQFVKLIKEGFSGKELKDKMEAWKALQEG